MGKSEGRGERERFLEETMLCHYLRGAVLKVQIPQVAIISLKFHVYNFFSFWNSRSIFEGQSRENWIHSKHLFCKSAFIELRSSFSTVGNSSLLLTRWPTFKVNSKNNVFLEVLFHSSRKAWYSCWENTDSQFAVIINTASQYFFYFV